VLSILLWGLSNSNICYNIVTVRGGFDAFPVNTKGRGYERHGRSQ
jgi:hypothetical protein